MLQLTAMKEIKTDKYIPPFAKTRNRLDIVHYVPYNGNSLSSGQSLDIHPEGTCCAVRCIREESSSYRPQKKFEVLVHYFETYHIFYSLANDLIYFLMCIYSGCLFMI